MKKNKIENIFKEKKALERDLIALGLLAKPDPISLALATKSDPTSFESDLGLASNTHWVWLSSQT